MEMRFTEEQARSIQHVGGHSITHAVAGSGKTQMLCGRVRFLLEQGIPARYMRVLAFNVKAVQEFRDRLERTLPAGWEAPKVSTFNSIGEQLVRLFEAQGWLPKLRLETRDGVETSIARRAATRALKKQNINTPPSQDEIEALRQFVSLVKSDIASPSDSFQRFRQPDHLRYFIDAYDFFEEERLREGVRFFVDQISDPVAVMRENSDALAMVTNKIDALLVDEFQDVNFVQVALLKQIIGTRGMLCAVGDENQAIYGWRGARPELSRSEFALHFPGATRFELSRTFRFGHQVSLAAALLIRNNRNREDTLCVSAASAGKTRIRTLRSSLSGDHSEVASVIESWGRARSLRECAVLARLWAQLMGIELSLMEREIPYVTSRGDLFCVQEVSGLLGYLRLASGNLAERPDRTEIARNMLCTPTLWLSAPVIRETSQRMGEDPGRSSEILRSLVRESMPPWQRKRIEDRAWACQSLMLQGGEVRAAEALRMYAMMSEMMEVFRKSGTNEGATEKGLAYEVLLECAERTGDRVTDFLARMDRLRAARERYAGGGDAVLLSTIHQAKGLEYPLVILAGLERGQFPSARGDPEEERRLMYVGMTRAREQLCLVAPPDERLEAAMRDDPPPLIDQSRRQASPFLYEAQLRTSMAVGAYVERCLAARDASNNAPEVPPACAGTVNRYLKAVGLSEIASEPACATTTPNASGDGAWEKGERVRHAVFGDGVVVGMTDRDIVEIDFCGQKRSLKISVAPMIRVE